MSIGELDTCECLSSSDDMASFNATSCSSHWASFQSGCCLVQAQHTYVNLFCMATIMDYDLSEITNAGFLRVVNWTSSERIHDCYPYWHVTCESMWSKQHAQNFMADDLQK